MRSIVSFVPEATTIGEAIHVLSVNVHVPDIVPPLWLTAAEAVTQMETEAQIVSIVLMIYLFIAIKISNELLTYERRLYK